MSKKYYFKEKNDTVCYPLADFLNEARSEGKKEITLFLAVPDRSVPQYVWCSEYENATERTACNNACPHWQKNGNSQLCQHRGRLYYPDACVTINVATGKPIKSQPNG